MLSLMCGFLYWDCLNLLYAYKVLKEFFHALWTLIDLYFITIMIPV